MAAFACILLAYLFFGSLWTFLNVHNIIYFSFRLAFKGKSCVDVMTGHLWTLAGASAFYSVLANIWFWPITIIINIFNRPTELEKKETQSILEELWGSRTVIYFIVATIMVAVLMLTWYGVHERKNPGRLVSTGRIFHSCQETATNPFSGIKKINISQLKTGESGWCQIAAMWVDAKGQCWLNGTYDVIPAPIRHDDIKVRKTRHDFHLEIPPDIQWEKVIVPPMLQLPVSDIAVQAER